MRRKGIGSHQSKIMTTDEWLTPPEILKTLGPFDLDPAAPINRPWDMAKKHYTRADDGLSKKWEGRIWCNPPYGDFAAPFLQRMAEHNQGTALMFARTETRMFFDHVWPYASSVLFIKGRLYFYYASGERAKANGGAPSVLITYGEECALRLKEANDAGTIAGKFILLNNSIPA